jgi:hypothetical protein
MTDLVAAIRAAIDEDERVARAADRRSRFEDPNDSSSWYYRDGEVRSRNGDGLIAAGAFGDDTLGLEFGEHIARFDPDRTLRRAAAHRKILDEILPDIRSGEQIINQEFGHVPAEEQASHYLLLALAEVYRIEVEPASGNTP